VPLVRGVGVILRSLLVGISLLPALVLGVWLSRGLTDCADAGRMRPAMLALCAAAGAVLLVRAVDALMAGA